MPLNTSIAIFAIDGGGTTGCATALLDMRRITVAAAMKRARAKSNIETWTVKGDHVEQAWTIARQVTDFYFMMHVEKALINFNSFYVVAESFQLRQMSAELTTVAVNAGIETLLKPAFNGRWGDVYFPQTASEAKGFCTNDMLDRWNLLRGITTHERDALRHIAARLDKML